MNIQVVKEGLHNILLEREPIRSETYSDIWTWVLSRAIQYLDLGSQSNYPISGPGFLVELPTTTRKILHHILHNNPQRLRLKRRLSRFYFVIFYLLFLGLVSV